MMLLTEKMEKEFSRVLGFSKFGLTSLEIFPFVRELRMKRARVAIRSSINEIITDPADNIFLECAVDGNADCIISADKHLLDLSSYCGIPILQPKDFLVREGYLQGE